MKTDSEVIRMLRALSGVSHPRPLVCQCGGDVELAGPGHGGAVRCNSCGAVHATLAALTEKAQ